MTIPRIVGSFVFVTIIALLASAQSSGRVSRVLVWKDSSNCSTNNFEVLNIPDDTCVSAPFVQSNAGMGSGNSSFSCEPGVQVNQSSCAGGSGGNQSFELNVCIQQESSSFAFVSCADASQNVSVSLPTTPQPDVTQWYGEWWYSGNCTGNVTDNAEYLNLECDTYSPGAHQRWLCIGDFTITAEYTAGCTERNMSGTIHVYPVNTCIDVQGNSFALGPCQPASEPVTPSTDVLTLLQFSPTDNTTAVPPPSDPQSFNVQFYASEGCSGEPINSTVMPLNQCLSVFVEWYNSTENFEYICTEAGVAARIFLEPSCTSSRITALYREGACTFDFLHNQWAVYGSCQVSQAATSPAPSSTSSNSSNTMR